MIAGHPLISDFVSTTRIARMLRTTPAVPASRAAWPWLALRTPLETRVLAEQVRLLSTGIGAALFNLVNSLVVAALLWDSFPQQAIVAWVGLTVAVVAGRILLFCHYKAAPGARTPAAWASLFTAGTAASGALWGALAVQSSLSGAIMEQVFVAFVIAGTTAGGLATLTAHLPAYIVYIGAAVLPLAAGFLVQSDPVYLAMGVLCLLYLIVMITTARSYARYITDTIGLRIENHDLQNELATARHAADNAARGKWEALAHLSHELRTPMNAVLGFSNSLQTQVFGPLGHPRYLEYSRHVHDSGRHVLDLITEILTLAEAETDNLRLNLEQVDVGAVARRCLCIVAADAEAKSIRLVDKISGEMPALLADRLKLRQLLLNLLSNGIKYTPPGGEVRIATRLEGTQIAIAVSDNGIGMAPEQVPQAMLPFVRLASPLTRATEGTGLGLPLCQRFAELHGGRLDITSAPNRGTTVTVLLPLRVPGQKGASEG